MHPYKTNLEDKAYWGPGVLSMWSYNVNQNVPSAALLALDNWETELRLLLINPNVSLVYHN